MDFLIQVLIYSKINYYSLLKLELMKEIGITIFLLVAIGGSIAMCPIGGLLILALCIVGLFKKPETNHSKNIDYENYIKFTRNKKK